MKLERHYPIREAAKLAGMGSRRTMMEVLESMGWQRPKHRNGERRITVPESLVLEIHRRYSVRPGMLARSVAWDGRRKNEHRAQTRVMPSRGEGGRFNGPHENGKVRLGLSPTPSPLRGTECV